MSLRYARCLKLLKGLTQIYFCVNKEVSPARYARVCERSIHCSGNIWHEFVSVHIKTSVHMTAGIFESEGKCRRESEFKMCACARLGECVFLPWPAVLQLQRSETSHAGLFVDAAKVVPEYQQWAQPGVGHGYMAAVIRVEHTGTLRTISKMKYYSYNWQRQWPKHRRKEHFTYNILILGQTWDEVQKQYLSAIRNSNMWRSTKTTTTKVCFWKRRTGEEKISKKRTGENQKKLQHTRSDLLSHKAGKWMLSMIKD